MIINRKTITGPGLMAGKTAKNYILLFFLSLLSALLFPLALPNELFKYGLPVLGFFCLTPFFIAIIKSPSFGIASVCGMIFALVSSYITYYWLQFFGNYTVYTIGGVLFGFVLYFSVLTPFLRGLPLVTPQFRPLVLAVAWTFYEFLKSSGFLAFPWALISHTMHEFLPFIQIVDITGVWGLSFLMTLVNAVAAEIILHPPEIQIKQFSLKAIRVNRLLQSPLAGQIFFTLFLLVLIFTYGIIRLNLPVPAERNVRVLLVQQNRDPWAMGRRNYELSLLQAETLTMEGIAEAGKKKPDIVVWSETSFQSLFSSDRAISHLEFFPEDKPFFPFVRETGCYFLVGAPYSLPDNLSNAMNSVVLLSPEGEVVQYYGKQHPVPFVESVPLYDIPFVEDFYRNVIGIHGVWTTADIPTVFVLPLRQGEDLSFSTPICFEDAFPTLCRKFILNGAEVLINLTNVSWSQTESAEIQMFVAAKFRAVENRRMLIRSTNSGVTSVVDAWGRVTEKLPLFTPAYLLADIPVMKTKSYTFYTRFGDYLPVIFGLIILGLCIYHTVYIYIFTKKLYDA